MWDLITHLFTHREKVKKGMEFASQYKQELSLAYKYRNLLIFIIAFCLLFTAIYMVKSIFSFLF